MGYFISNADNRYYEGDKANYLDQDVPQRPSADYAWSGSEWSYSPQQAGLGEVNYKALVRRIAEELAEKGQQYDALILLKSIGE